MPNLLQFDPQQFLGFLIVFARIAGVMLTAPILSDGNIPIQVRTAFTFLLSLIFFPVVASPVVPANPSGLMMLVLTAKELGVGALLGFSGKVLFAGITLAGEVIGFQMGVGVASILDPSTQTQQAVLGVLQTTLAMLMFLTLDGHHLFITALVDSYRFVPPGGIALNQAGFDFGIRVASEMFVVGLRLGAPLIVALLAANLSIGLIARSVPQVNVFVVGFPFTIGLGLLLLALGLPFFMQAVIQLHETLQDTLVNGLQAVRGTP